MSALLDRVEAFVKAEFSRALPAELTYHSPEHTEMVVENCKLLAHESGLNADDTELVLIAAWMHDIGLTKRYEGHEAASCDIAATLLDAEKYPQQSIEKVLGCIRVTQIPQIPQTLLEKVVCDADLLYLGTNNYTLWADRLRAELQNALHQIYTDEEWRKYQLTFLYSHRYHTPYASRVFEQKLQDVIKQLEAETSR